MPSNGQVLSFNTATSSFQWVANAGGGFSGVDTNSTLTGDGTAGDPLGVAAGGIGAVQLGPNAVTEAKIDALNNASDGYVLAYDSNTGRLEWVVNTGEHEAADLRRSPRMPRSAATVQPATRFPLRSYVGPAFQSASYLANDRELFFQALDSAEDQRLPLTFIGILHGVGGDTFITNEAFHFGDSAIIGHLFYLYTHRVTANYSPTSILNAPAGHFMNFPILDNGILRTGQIAAGGSTAQVLTRTAAGHAWQDATGGGLSAVATDATLDGDGTTGDPLAYPACIHNRTAAERRQRPAEFAGVVMGWHE